MRNEDIDSETITEVFRVSRKGNSRKLVLWSSLALFLGVGAYIVSGSSSFYLVKENTSKTIARVFIGNGGSELVEVVDLNNKDNDNKTRGVFETIEYTNVVESGEILGVETLTDEPSLPVKVNINTAGILELQAITGVSPVIAGRIVNYRTINGDFVRIEDITRILGIGEKTFDVMRDQITVGG